MVICKYFIRGTCRFGENCKNEHCYNDSADSAMRKKPDVDTNVIIKAVSNDMDKAEKGNQWPLSSYGPFQGKVSFPGFDDKCFEEIRLGMYEAERNGTTEQYKQQLTHLLQEARMKIRSLQNPTSDATNVLKELFIANTQETPTGNSIFGSQSTFGTNTNAAAGGSIFDNAGNTLTSPSVFKMQTPATNPSSNFTFSLPENKTVFNTMPTSQANTSIFSQTAAPNQFASTGSIFGGGAPQNQTFTQAQPQTFSSNSMFKNNPVTLTNQSIFGNTNQIGFPSPNLPNNQSVFVPQTQNSPFSNQINSNASPFGAQNTPPSYPGAQPPPAYGAQPVPALPSYGAQTVNTQSPFGTQPGFGNTFVQTPTNQTQMNPFQMNQSPFGGPQAIVPENKSIFATASNSIFGNPPKDMSQFHQVVNPAEHSKSIFGTPQITTNFMNTRKHDDPTIYSKLEDLSENELKSYEARSFEFGKIPEKPPTLQLCS